MLQFPSLLREIADARVDGVRRAVQNARKVRTSR